MKLFSKGLTLVLLVACCNAGNCKENSPLLKNYLEGIKQMSRNCVMSYKVSCIYPDKSPSNVAGRLAINGENYYDSSNIRLVLKNSKWLIAADHQTEMLNVVYLPDWKKQMGADVELDISGYLLNAADMEDLSNVKVTALGRDSFKVSLQYQVENAQVISLVLYYPKGEVVPGRYEGMMTYPMEPSGTNKKIPTQSLTIRFECYDISATADGALFNDSRFIKVAGGKAQMKRYNNYKVYRKAN